MTPHPVVEALARYEWCATQAALATRTLAGLVLAGACHEEIESQRLVCQEWVWRLDAAHAGVRGAVG